MEKMERERGVPVELPEGKTCGFHCPALGRALDSCGYDFETADHRALCVGSVCARSDPDAVVAMTLNKRVR